MDFEAKLQNFYESILRPGMNAIDVGAHAGRHCLEMARLVGPEGRVYAYEPIPSLYEALKKLTLQRPELKDVLKVYPYACSNNEGIVDFCLAVDAPEYSGILERTYDIPTRIKHISVQSRMLDTLLDPLIQINFIKIDTEGAEWNVIQGASNLIKRCRPHISFEFGENSYRNYGVDPGIVFAFFQEIDYWLFDLHGRKLTKESFSASSVRQSVWDYVASPAEHASEAAATLSGTFTLPKRS